MAKGILIHYERLNHSEGRQFCLFTTISFIFLLPFLLFSPLALRVLSHRKTSFCYLFSAGNQVLPPITSQQPLEWCQLCFYLAGRCENVHVQKSRCQASTSCNWKGKKEYRTHWGIKQASLRSTTFKKNYEVAFMELGTLLLTLKQQLDLSTQA